LKIFTKLYTD